MDFSTDCWYLPSHYGRGRKCQTFTYGWHFGPFHLESLVTWFSGWITWTWLNKRIPPAVVRHLCRVVLFLAVTTKGRVSLMIKLRITGAWNLDKIEDAYCEKSSRSLSVSAHPRSAAGKSLGCLRGGQLVDELRAFSALLLIPSLCSLLVFLNVPIRRKKG